MNAEAGNLVEGLVIGDDRIMVTHLQFANNTIIFLKANQDNVKRMDLCLEIFQVILGLKVGVNVEENVLLCFVDLMGCSVGKWPIKYLGMPLGGNPRVVAFWDLVVKRFLKGLHLRRSYISFGGRIMLIKGALSNIPNYYISLFMMSIKVECVIEKLQ